MMHEQDEDEQRGREEERRVDALEGLARVGRVAGRPGHLRLETGRRAVGDRLADRVDGVDEHLLVAVGDDLHDDERGLAVLGVLRRADRDDALGRRGRELRLDPCDRLAIRGR